MKNKDEFVYTTTHDIAEDLASKAEGLVKFKKKLNNLIKNEYYSFYFTHSTLKDKGNLVFYVYDDNLEYHYFIINDDVEVKRQAVSRKEIVNEFRKKQL